MPSARYSTWLAIPSRDPRTAAPRRTTIGCSVNGTGVNGNGMLICAAMTVSTVTKATAPARSAILSARESVCRVAIVSRVGCMNEV